MKMTISELRGLVRAALLAEDEIRNVGSSHKKTKDTDRVLKKMQLDPRLADLMSRIDTSPELLGLLQSIVDASQVSDADVMTAVNKLVAHEKAS